MKTLRTIAAITILATLATAGSAFAQRGQGRGFANNPQGQGMMNNAERPYGYGQCILDLTPEQDAQITELRTKHLKEVTPLRNELGEKRARLRTLQTAENPNLNEINQTIDEMASIRANIQKKGAAHRAEVASLLTDEQKVIYNSRRQGRMGRKGSAGMRQGMGQGMGRGMQTGGYWN